MSVGNWTMVLASDIELLKQAVAQHNTAVLKVLTEWQRMLEAGQATGTSITFHALMHELRASMEQ